MHYLLRSWIGGLLCCGLSLFLFAACEDDETDLGLSLQDQNALYYGIHDTIEGADLTAYTLYDDSLRTSGYNTAMVGYCQDEVYGRVAARSFLQLALTNNSGLDFARNHYVVDSAILSMAIDERYPDFTGARTVHLRITQTADVVSPDSIYYAFSSLPLGTTVFLDTTLTISVTDSVLRLPLNASFCSLLSDHAFPSDDVLRETVKGLCVECVEADSDPLIITFNLGKTTSGLSLYYQDLEGETQQESMQVGYTTAQSNSTHFCQFSHTYSGQLQQLQQGTLDSIEGSSRLYLEPLGGMMVRLDMDAYVQAFHAAHPRAVIHYAELQLPVSDNYATDSTSRIVAYRRYESGSSIFVSDFMTNNSSYDGCYDADKGLYRIRLTQHLQGLLLQGADYGTLLMLEGRRSSARRTVLNGTQAARPVRMVFVYTE